MGNFLLKFLLFLLPIGALFVFPSYVFWQGREFTPIDSAIESQKNPQPVLFGLAYRNVDKDYKEVLIRSRNSDVVALGTSRVMEFRSSFFNDSEAFTNGGGATPSLEDMRAFIKTLPLEGKTRILILGLDQKFFRENQSTSTEVKGHSNDALHAFLASAWREIYLDFIAKKFTLTALRHAHESSADIGMSALVEKNGFLNDGSYYYGKITGNPARISDLQSSVQEVLDRTHRDRSSFYYDAAISSASLQLLGEILAECREHRIFCVGIIPPYAPALYKEMARIDDEYSATMRTLSISISKVFSASQFPVFDYTDATKIGITDTEFIDPGHVSDKADLRILIDMARRSDVLRHYVSLEKLRYMLEHTSGDFVYTPRELQR